MKLLSLQVKKLKLSIMVRKSRKMALVSTNLLKLISSGQIMYLLYMTMRLLFRSSASVSAYLLVQDLVFIMILSLSDFLLHLLLQQDLLYYRVFQVQVKPHLHMLLVSLSIIRLLLLLFSLHGVTEQSFSVTSMNLQRSLMKQSFSVQCTKLLIMKTSML